MSAKAVSRSTGGTAIAVVAPESVSAPPRIIGPSSIGEGRRTRSATSTPAAPTARVHSQPVAVPIAGGSGAAAAAPASAAWCPGNRSGMSSGVSSTTTSTRAYCMKATSRSSPWRSRAIVTMPDAPPAIIPIAAVGASTSVTRASTTPTARLTPSVPALTSTTAGHSSPSTRSDEDCR